MLLSGASPEESIGSNLFLPGSLKFEKQEAEIPQMSKAFLVLCESKLIQPGLKSLVLLDVVQRRLQMRDKEAYVEGSHFTPLRSDRPAKIPGSRISRLSGRPNGNGKGDVEDTPNPRRGYNPPESAPRSRSLR